MNQEIKTGSFITKLYSIIRNTNFEPIIKFDQEEGKLYIFNKERIEAQILPLFFRHNKFTSFIRQLNLYGFKKVRNSSALCFTHSFLLKGKSFVSIIAKKKQKRVGKKLFQSYSLNGNQQQIGQSNDINEIRLENNNQNENISDQNAQGNIPIANQQPTMLLEQMGSYFQNYQRAGSSEFMTYYFSVHPFFPTTPFLHFYVPKEEK